MSPTRIFRTPISDTKSEGFSFDNPFVANTTTNIPNILKQSKNIFTCMIDIENTESTKQLNGKNCKYYVTKNRIYMSMNTILILPTE